MLYEFDGMKGTTLHALDGHLGKIKDLYFDDKDWKIRYLIAETGSWFTERKVLLSPASVESVDLGDGGEVRMNLTKAQIESSPPIASDQPVSRKMETRVVQYYNWPAYWAVPSPALGIPVMVSSPSDPQSHAQVSGTEPSGLPVPPPVEDAGLRSVEEVRGYGIRTQDGSIGYVADFICDPETWRICYLVLDTRRVLPGSKVLLPPSIIDSVSWDSGSVSVMSTEGQIRNAPTYDDSKPIDSADEAAILAHFGHGAFPAASQRETGGVSAGSQAQHQA